MKSFFVTLFVKGHGKYVNRQIGYACYFRKSKNFRVGYSQQMLGWWIKAPTYFTKIFLSGERLNPNTRCTGCTFKPNLSLFIYFFAFFVFYCFRCGCSPRLPLVDSCVSSAASCVCKQTNMMMGWWRAMSHLKSVNGPWSIQWSMVWSRVPWSGQWFHGLVHGSMVWSMVPWSGRWCQWIHGLVNGSMVC